MEPSQPLTIMELIKSVVGFSATDYTVCITLHKAIVFAAFIAIGFSIYMKCRKKEIK